MSNIKELRSVLFETLNGLRNGTIDIDKSKAINEISQTIINSARVEIDFVKATGSSHGTGFIEIEPEIKTTGNKTVHRLI